MEDYERMYYHLFNTLTNAVNSLSAVLLVLKATQLQTEQMMMGMPANPEDTAGQGRLSPPAGMPERREGA